MPRGSWWEVQRECAHAGDPGSRSTPFECGRGVGQPLLVLPERREDPALREPAVEQAPLRGARPCERASERTRIRPVHEPVQRTRQTGQPLLLLARLVGERGTDAPEGYRDVIERLLRLTGGSRRLAPRLDRQRVPPDRDGDAVPEEEHINRSGRRRGPLRGVQEKRHAGDQRACGTRSHRRRLPIDEQLEPAGRQRKRRGSDMHDPAGPR